jgi:hypothetical protein
MYVHNYDFIKLRISQAWIHKGPPSLRPCMIYRNKLQFNGAGLLSPRPTPMAEDRPLLTVRDCLFNIFAATLQPQPEDGACRRNRDPCNMGL